MAKGTQNDKRNNHKASKKTPGPAKMEKTNFSHINGRTANSNLQREAWTAKGGRANHTTIPHWKTGKIYNGPFPYKSGKVEVNV